MRSCARTLATVLAFVALSAIVGAESTGAATAYRRALQREAELRMQLDASSPKPAARSALLKRLRTMVADYERLSAQYPVSGYSDNALWQGALLEADAYWQFGESSDRRTARRLLDQLAARFPSSSLVPRIADVRQRLDRARVPPSTVSASARSAVVKPAAGNVAATLTAIRREVLPDAVRLTLVLERETPFSSQRLDNPSRVTVDLQDTRVVYALKDAQLTYATDVVRKVQVAHPSGARTRIVIDLERAGRYSVYPVYDPYRLVIDVERPAARSAAPSLVAGATAPARSTPPSSAARTPAASARPEATTGPGRGIPAPQAALGRGANQPTGRSATSGTGRAGYSLSRQLGLGAARIVIDAGHGGHDPGAQVMGLDESALVLDVALRLEQLLLKTPGVEVIMTRRTSEYIPLDERTLMANRANADLFLSIHANASPNPSARGVETYFLNFAPNAEAEAIAKRENAVSGKSMRDLTDIVRAITLNDKIDESRDFAMRVQQSLYGQLRKSNKQVKSLGVKQAPFQVLIGATMPSVLAEISFLTNEQEGELLKSDAYRDQIAAALCDGIMGYQRSLKASKAAADKATD
jgi:N-acetylmuramoyl-L-alanine amidase